MEQTLNLEQFSYVIAIILLIASIISPIVTAIINNKYQLDLKKLDIYEDAKRKSLSEFIIACEKYMLSSSQVSSGVCSEYYSSINNLYIYFEISDYSIFTNLEQTLKKQNVINSNHELTKIIQVLSKQIKKK